MDDSATDLPAEEPSTENVSRGERPAGGIEIVLAALAIPALLWAMLLIADRQNVLMGHGLWYDEIVTWTLANDPQLGRPIEAIRGAFDANPPTLAILLRPIAQNFGSGPEPLRWAMLAAMGVAMLGAYVLLRRVAGPLAAAAGALVIWASPLGMGQAFEPRFYMPLLAATAWVGVFSPAVWRSEPGVGRIVGRLLFAATAAFACALHYFGIVGVGLLMLPQLFAHRRTLFSKEGGWVGRWLALLAGPLALLACFYFLLAQRDFRGGVTWMADKPIREMPDYIARITLDWALAPVLIGLAVGVAVSPGTRTRPARPLTAELRGALLLVLMPTFLMAFTLLLQPATQPRYGIVMLLGLAAISALVLRHGGRLASVLAIVGLLGFSAMNLRDLVRGAPGELRRDATFAARVQQATDTGLPTLFVRHQNALEYSYALARRPDGTAAFFPDDPATRVLVLDLAKLDRAAWADHRVENDVFMQLGYEAGYADAPGGPHRANPPGRGESFCLVNADWLDLTAAFPNHNARRVNPNVVRLDPK